MNFYSSKSPVSKTWTILEKIFAPLQDALLALARSAEVYAVNCVKMFGAR